MKFIVTIILGFALGHPDADNLGVLVYNDITLQVEDAEVEQVVDYFGNDLNLLLKVYWKTKNRDGCDKAKTVSLHLRNQPAIVVLDRIARQMGTDDSGATWQLRDGVVEIGLKEELAKKPFQRLVTYPIMDLLFVVNDFSFLDQNSGRTAPETTEQRQARIDKLIEKITRLIEPDVWEQNGGPCTITNYKETVIVGAPNFVHRQIGGYPFSPTKPEGVSNRELQINRSRTSVKINYPMSN
jgi:hypothetical protein